MYKKIILIISLFFTTLSAEKQALIVGVADYKGQKYDLPGIDYDVNKMKNLFTSWGFKVKVLLDAESMKTEKYLSLYANSLNQEDIFVFYYSGHGSYAPDQNGDEKDGQDESIVLSDGNRDYHYLDDELNYRLNKIKAKKMLLFDSCHSGTVNKGKSKFMAKTIPTTKIELFSSKNLHSGGEIQNGQFVILSASLDSEQSRASSLGSLFTNELYELLSDGKTKKNTFSSLQNIATRNIVNQCKRNKINPHHPSLSTSSEQLKDISMFDYLSVKESSDNQTSPISVKSVQVQLDAMYQNDANHKILITKNKVSYNTGEYVQFTLNTNNKEGYLSILYVEKDDITVLFPNPKKPLKLIKGEYHFPKDFGHFKIEAYKNCKNCNLEKTTIYTLLTPQPLVQTKKLTQEKVLNLVNKSTSLKVLSKAVRRLEKVEIEKKTKISIGKYEFLVY